MSDQVGPYRVVDLPPARRVMINMLDLSGPKHCMYGLLEVDVTVARQFIAEHKARTGETLSFTGFLILCLARAVDEDKAVQAYLKGCRPNADGPRCHCDAHEFSFVTERKMLLGIRERAGQVDRWPCTEGVKNDRLARIGDELSFPRPCNLSGTAGIHA